VEKFNGKSFAVTLTIDKPNEMEQITKQFTLAGARVTAQGTSMQVEGDLGKILGSVLKDSDLMFKNDGSKLKTAYGYDEKEVMQSWWTALNKMDKFFKKNLKIEESKIVSEVSKKGVEPAYNFYGIESQRVIDRAGIMTFLLVFYVAYTLWWGYAIFFLFEGVGLSMKKAKVKKEV